MVRFLGFSGGDVGFSLGRDACGGGAHRPCASSPQAVPRMGTRCIRGGATGGSVEVKVAGRDPALGVVGVCMAASAMGCAWRGRREEGTGTGGVDEDAMVAGGAGVDEGEVGGEEEGEPAERSGGVVAVDGGENEGGVGGAVRAGGARARPGGGLRSCEPGCPTAWCQ